jgi:hypothetical protein
MSARSARGRSGVFFFDDFLFDDFFFDDFRRERRRSVGGEVRRRVGPGDVGDGLVPKAKAIRSSRLSWSRRGDRLRMSVMVCKGAMVLVVRE